MLIEVQNIEELTWNKSWLTLPWLFQSTSFAGIIPKTHVQTVELVRKPAALEALLYVTLRTIELFFCLLSNL